MRTRDPIHRIVALLLVGSVLFLVSGVVASFLRSGGSAPLDAASSRGGRPAADPRRGSTAPAESSADRAAGAASRESLPLEADRATADRDAAAGLAEDSSRFVVEGRVLDSRGLPLTDATACLELRHGSRASAVRGVASPPVLTAADGSFAFVGSLPGSPTASISLCVQAPGLAPHVSQHDLDPASGWLDLGELRLLDGGSLSGTILDSGGAAVAGASATLEPASGNPLEAWGDLARLLPPARADAAGRFRFEGVAAGAYRVAASAPGMQEGRVRDSIVVAAGRDVTVDPIRLNAGVILRGRVVAPDASPVAGAEVRVRATGAGARFSGRAATGDDGRFRLEHLPPGRFQVEARAGGFLRGRAADVDPEAAAEVVVRLEAGLAVMGSVVDSKSGAPVERFAARIRALGSADAAARARIEAIVRELEARRAESERSREAVRAPRIPGELGPVTEHAAGRFEFTGLDEGSYVVDVASARHAFASSATVEVAPGRPPPELSIELERGLTVSGTVVARKDGAALAGARVELVAVDEEASAIAEGRLRDGAPSRFAFAFALPGPRGDVVASARTDAGGRFELGPAIPGRHLLRASHERAAGGKSETFELRSDRGDFRLELGATATLRGAIRGIPSGLESDVEVLAVGGFGVMRTTRARADSSYRLDGLPPGSYALRVYVAETSDALARQMTAIFSGDGPAPAFDVTLAEGELRDFELTLEPPRIGAVEGQVQVNGRPARGYPVILRVAPGATPSALARTQRSVVDAQGRFAFSGIHAGDYVVQVTGASSRQEVHREAVTVAVDSISPVRVDLSLGGLRGRVTADDDPAAAPLEGTLTLLPGVTSAPADLSEFARAHRVHVVRVRDGAFQSEDLTAGPALLLLELRGRERMESTLEIPVGTSREVVLKAGRAR